eukprot:c24177_g1_i3 orf=434-2566(-)
MNCWCSCAFPVTPATNGLLAWELLMDQTNHVDLVLTEVVMPCLSGTGLLGRIMSHEAFKHIPVIMMSSHDSMNIVFKCLSKGAADFLVKPVRKNELKNLWQHVWRRCHSASASRSGSGSQTRKTERPNGAAADLNESGSNSDSDKTSSEFNIRGGSDNGSGTQIPWSRGALEVESCHQSNKAHTTGLKASGSGLHSANNPEDVSLLGPEHHGVDNALASDISRSKVAGAEAIYLNNVTSTHEVPGTEAACSGDAELAGSKDAGSGSSQGNAQRAVDLTGIPYSKDQDSNEEQQEDSEDEGDLLEKHASNSPSSKDKNLSDSSSPSLLGSANILDLGLKPLREGEDHDREKGRRGGLIHSFASAFSRYNTSSSFTPLISRTNPANTHTMHVGCGNYMPAQQSGNGRSHKSSVVFTSQRESSVLPNHGIDEELATPFLENSNRLEGLPQTRQGTANKEDVLLSLPPVPGSFPPSKQPMFSGVPHAVHWEASAQVGECGEVKDCAGSYKQEGYVYTHTNNYSQYHHHAHHHHHHHHIQHHYHHVSDEKPQTPQPNDQTVTDVGTGAPRCGSSNMANGAEGNIGASGSSNGYGSNGNAAASVNGSATGSNIGSNGVQSAAVALPGGGTMEVNAQVEADTGLLDTNGVLSGHDENRFARREAALTKFRQKRKERCFEKKVRYQSRKRLAEQRPRVRGQFVKQTLYESTIGEAEES